MEQSTASLKKVDKNELLDLLENTGILQEANRTFFHPIGLNLKLNEDFNLIMEETEDPKGVILHTVDKFKLNAFRTFANTKHDNRQKMTGFLIQTKDMIRQNILEVPLTPAPVMRLQSILKHMDNAYYEVKKKVMTVSPDKDNSTGMINENDLYYKIHENIQHGKLINATARMLMLEKLEQINNDIKQINKIAEQQKEYYKESDDDQ